MERQLMIDLLVEEQLRRARDGDARAVAVLEGALRDGFRGYAAFSDEALADALERQGPAFADGWDDAWDASSPDVEDDGLDDLDDLRELADFALPASMDEA